MSVTWVWICQDNSELCELVGVGWGTEVLPNPVILPVLRIHRPWIAGGLWAYPKSLQ